MISRASIGSCSIKIKQFLLNHLLPLSCLLCQQPCSHPLSLCVACQKLIVQPKGICLVEHTPKVRLINTSKAGPCKPVLWQTLRCLSSYQSPVKELIGMGKFKHNLAALKVLGQLLSQLIHEQEYDPHLVLIPVPLHQERLLSRGFNQAYEIALPIAKTLELTINRHCIKRIQAAKTQHFLSRQQRQINAQNLFQIMGSVPKKVAVIDDIYTTGATLRSICSCLAESGAELIEVWIIARTL